MQLLPTQRAAPTFPQSTSFFFSLSLFSSAVADGPSSALLEHRACDLPFTTDHAHAVAMRAQLLLPACARARPHAQVRYGSFKPPEDMYTLLN